MSNSIFSKDILSLVAEYTTKIPRKHNIQKKYPDRYKQLLIETSFLPDDVPISQRFWHITHNNNSIPLCEHCGQHTVGWHNSKAYVDYCSSLCASRSTKTMEKKKKTCLSKYGTTSYSKTEHFKEMFKTDEYLQKRNSPVVREKIKQTNLKRYGVENVFQSPGVREKIKQTNLKRYGVENAGGITETQIKIKKTIKEKYGVDHYNETEEFKRKMKAFHNNDALMKKTQDTHKATMQLKYGVDYTFELDTVKAKIKETYDAKYNGKHPAQMHISEQSLSKLNDSNWLREQHHNQLRTASSIADELSVCVSTVIDYLRKHSIEVKRFMFSTGEREITTFLDTLGVQYIVNSSEIISPFELDIYLPEHNLAIEYNGLYWHSDAAGKRSDYHLAKTECCERKGIRLIHIFEDEWVEQKQKCKDTILHILGLSERGTYARNTNIVEIPWKVAKEFLDKYHLLNAGVAGSFRIGAYDKNNKLIGVMVFGQSNNEGGDDTIELKRFVTDKKNNPGLGSKMFKYAIRRKEYTEVIAFVDRRWFTGLVKDYIGFEKISVTDPALWFTDGENRFHRRFKTKTQLIKDGYDVNKPKHVILRELGYYRIWDSGKVKLKWSI